MEEQKPLKPDPVVEDKSFGDLFGQIERVSILRNERMLHI